MKRLTNSNTSWLLFFAIAAALDTLGLALPRPLWLRYSLLIMGILALLVGIVIVGQLQRTE